MPLIGAGRNISPRIAALIAASGASVLTGKSLWVDSVYGNDGTGAPDLSKPYQTIGAALAFASGGDTVQVRPGTYAESGLTVPANVSLVGIGGYEVTSITGAAATGNRVTLSAGSVLENFAVTIPTDATAAVLYAGALPAVAGVRFIKLQGQAGSVGFGIDVTGGKLIGLEIRYGTLECDAILQVGAGGVMAVQAVHVPPAPGVVNAVQVAARCTGGRLQALDFNVGSPEVLTGVEVGAGTAVLISLNFFQLQDGLRITANTASVEAYGGKIDAAQFNIVVDPGLTGVGGLVRANAQMERKFSIPNTWFDSDHAWQFYTKTDATADASYQFWGVDTAVGHPEKGSGFYSGEGLAYATGNTVLTYDGATYVDISAAAESKDGSPFTFPGTAVSDSIMWCTNRTDAAGATLKHWTAQFLQTTAASGGAFVFEIYDGMSWVAVGCQAVQVANQYRYANSVFLRANSLEDIRLGIDGDTSWPEAIFSAVTGRWARVRITSSPATLPAFEQLKLTPSQFALNDRGQRLAHGLAQWRQTLFGSANTWSEGNSAGDYNEDVGTGVGAGSLTGWSGKVKKGRFNAANDYINFQFNVPGGICTAFPLRFSVTCSSQTAQAGVDLAVAIIPQPVEGILVAAAGGSAVPVARPVADVPAYDSLPSTLNQTNTFDITAKKPVVQSYDLDIADVYEGDLLFVMVLLTTSNTVDIHSLAVEGVSFTSGKVI